MHIFALWNLMVKLGRLMVVSRRVYRHSLSRCWSCGIMVVVMIIVSTWSIYGECNILCWFCRAWNEYAREQKICIEEWQEANGFICATMFRFHVVFDVFCYCHRYMLCYVLKFDCIQSILNRAPLIIKKLKKCKLFDKWNVSRSHSFHFSICY